MKQTQGPQRFAFCTNQINIFNKAYRYQTAIQLYEKNLTIHTIFKCTNATKTVCNPGNKNTIEIGKLFLKKRQLCKEARSNRRRDRQAKKQSENSCCLSEKQTKTQAVTRLKDKVLSDSTARGRGL